jgi:hypothetical protein
MKLYQTLVQLWSRRAAAVHRLNHRANHTQMVLWNPVSNPCLVRLARIEPTGVFRISNPDPAHDPSWSILEVTPRMLYLAGSVSDSSLPSGSRRPLLHAPHSVEELMRRGIPCPPPGLMCYRELDTTLLIAAFYDTHSVASFRWRVFCRQSEFPVVIPRCLQHRHIPEEWRKRALWRAFHQGKLRKVGQILPRTWYVPWDGPEGQPENHLLVVGSAPGLVRGAYYELGAVARPHPRELLEAPEQVPLLQWIRT